ncbi:MAG: response regulator RpfG family c-di-GMP phosphodiesterase [Psychroserpens sp.]|jgi:response regulator RpfG family c-di-GMP phosphodiesterase
MLINNNKKKDDIVGKTILIIDHNSQFIDVLIPVLTQLGYNVKSCENAAEAIQLVEEIIVDLVLSELYLPTLRADKLFSMLLRNKPTLICCLMTSAYYNDPIIKKTIKLKNVKGLIKKPFSFEELNVCIKKAFSFEELNVIKKAFA